MTSTRTPSTLRLPSSIIRSPGGSPRHPDVGVRLVHLPQDPGNVVGQPPVRVVRLELRHAADPPLVVADPRLVDVPDLRLPAGQLLGDPERLQVGSVGVPAAPEVVDLAGARV